MKGSPVEKQEEHGRADHPDGDRPRQERRGRKPGPRQQRHEGELPVVALNAPLHADDGRQLDEREEAFGHHGRGGEEDEGGREQREQRDGVGECGPDAVEAREVVARERGRGEEGGDGD